MTLVLDPGHRAVVIGAGAIGHAVARAYAAAGAQVLVLDLDPGVAHDLAATLPGDGHRSAPLDVTDLAAARAAASEAARRGGVSSLSYTAGLALTFDVLDFDWEGYRQTMAVNLDGALHVAHAFGRHMAAAGRGSMSFISSIAGIQGAPGAAAYCASKAALIAVVQAFAAEVGPRGVRVNALCPGEVDTPMLARVAAQQASRRSTSLETELGELRAAAALRRLVRPEEVADAVVWLASAGASAITGARLDVTAGLGAR